MCEQRAWLWAGLCKRSHETKGNDLMIDRVTKIPMDRFLGHCILDFPIVKIRLGMIVSTINEKRLSSFIMGTIYNFFFFLVFSQNKYKNM